MKIDRAIEILTSDKKEVLISSIADLRAAQQLGIEALKLLHKNRTTIKGYTFIPLPGETEEVK